MFISSAINGFFTLSLHDALPISLPLGRRHRLQALELPVAALELPTRPLGRLDLVSGGVEVEDRKSTRLNSSHPSISYAVFCLKKKNTKIDLFYYKILDSKIIMKQ